MEAGDRPNLTLLLETWAYKLDFVEGEEEGVRARGVHVRTKDGAETLISARREVIVCAGAVDTPRLLLHSGVGPRADLERLGIPVVHDLPGVGCNLHDHIDVVQVVDAPQLTDLFGLSITGIANVLAGIFEWRKHRSGLLTTNFAEAGGFIRSTPRESIPDLQLHFVIGKLIDHGRKTVFGHGYSCHVCLLRPTSRGSVTLRTADPLAAPRIDPNFLAEADDVRRLVRGFQAMREILAQPVLAGFGGRELPMSAGVRDEAAIEAFIRQHADTIYHPVGTCRMGRGALDVVDEQLRVRGVEGLRVVDASIMPRIVGGNTNAPVIMIGEKAADLVKAAARRQAALTSAEPVPA
jgi:choline dehydrogenase-like flavoprotein